MIYDQPGVTYDGAPTSDSLLTAIERIEQLWEHMSLNTITPGGFTRDGIVLAMQTSPTPFPSNVTHFNGHATQGSGQPNDPVRPA